MRRRAFLAAAGTASLAGCASAVESYVSSEPEEENPSEPSFSQFNQTPPSQPEPDSNFPRDDSEVHGWEPEEVTETPDPDNSGPVPEVRRLIQSDPRIISVDHTTRWGSDEFSATIQNIGIAGDVIVDLRWIEESSEGLPIAPEKRDTLYFRADERRTVSFYEEMPEHVDRYEFITRTGTHGAVVKNTGESGRVDVKLRGDMSGMDWNLGERTVYLDEDEEQEIVFNRDSPMLPSEWWVEAEPAD